MVDHSIEEILSWLVDTKHHTREKGKFQLCLYIRSLIDNPSSSDSQNALSTLVDKCFALSSNTDSWESRQGGFYALKALLYNGKPPASSSRPTAGQVITNDTQRPTLANVLPNDLPSRALAAALAHLEDPEGRVRLALGEVLGVLAAMQGFDIWASVGAVLYESIDENAAGVDREPSSAILDSLGAVAAAESGTDAPSRPTGEHGAPKSAPAGEALRPPGSPRSVRSAASSSSMASQKLLPDNEGWKALETSLLSLKLVLEGIGAPKGASLVNGKLMSTLDSACAHPNRYVREIGHLLIAAAAPLAAADPEVIARAAPAFVRITAAGLADNWSQVRFAGSVAVRAVLTSVGGVDGVKQWHGLLLPRMALNRYYVAEGVRVYSLATWMDLVGQQGKTLIQTVLPETVGYYAKAVDADNHAVREAACHCIAELAVKLPHEPVAAHVTQLTTALLTAFKDASWPVRDAACVALGSFVAEFPEESSPCHEDVFHLWKEHLSDNIWSVREDSALAIGKAVNALNNKELDAKVLAWVKELLPSVNEQPQDSQSFRALDNVTTFGVAGPSAAAEAEAKRARDNDVSLHSGQAMFSCGSLNPKSGGGSHSHAAPPTMPGQASLPRGGGCMDHGFTRPREPWESTDGAVYLLRELVPRFNARTVGRELLPLLATASAACNGFAHGYQLLQTIWKAVPVIAKRMDRRAFVPVIGKLLPQLMATTAHSNRLASAAATYALEDLVEIFGLETVEQFANDDQVRAIRQIVSQAPGAQGASSGMMGSNAGGLRPVFT